MNDEHTDQSRQAAQDSPDYSELPAYAERLLALHRSHLAELGEIVDSLPLREGQRVVDVATGDGTFAQLLADRDVRVCAVDINDSCLELARARLGPRPSVTFQKADALRLPFEEGAFQGAFCAQSLYSLPDARRTLEEMLRVTEPGGWVAVLEDDTLHRVILPWPADLELAIRTAELEWFERQAGDPATFYAGRRLSAEFENLGLQDVQTISFSTERHAPLSRDERTFLLGFLKEIEGRIRGIIAPEQFARFERMCDPEHPEFLLEMPGLAVTYLDFLCIGTKPDDAPGSQRPEGSLGANA